MRLLLIFIFLLLIGTVAAFLAHKHQSYVITKFNQIRLTLLDGQGPDCLIELENLGVEFTSLGDQGSKKCPVLNAVRLSSLGQTNISTPVVLSCPAAVKLAQWAKDIHAEKITHIGALNCRMMRGRRFMSEHSFGLAIDITALDDAIVSKHWNDKGARGEKLRYAARQACRHFSNVLTPNTNRLHHGHFHFDDGFGYSCDVAPVNQIK